MSRTALTRFKGSTLELEGCNGTFRRATASCSFATACCWLAVASYGWPGASWRLLGLAATAGHGSGGDEGVRQGDVDV
jgi:hypothetical protein